MSDTSPGGGPKRVVDDRIAEWVDGCLSDRDRERFTAELRVNPQLRKDLEDYERTVAAVRAALRAPTVPVNLADRVIEAIGKPVVVTRPVRFRPRWQSMVWSLAAAAALLAFAVWLNAWEGKPAGVSTTDQAGAPLRAAAAQDDQLNESREEATETSLEALNKEVAAAGSLPLASGQEGVNAAGAASQDANSAAELLRRSSAEQSGERRKAVESAKMAEAPAPEALVLEAGKPAAGMPTAGAPQGAVLPGTPTPTGRSAAPTEAVPLAGGRQAGGEPGAIAGMAQAASPKATDPAGPTAPAAGEGDKASAVGGARSVGGVPGDSERDRDNSVDYFAKDQETKDSRPGTRGRGAGQTDALGRAMPGGAKPTSGAAPLAGPPIPVVVITAVRAKAEPAPGAPPEAKDKPEAKEKSDRSRDVGQTYGFTMASAGPEFAEFFLAQFAPVTVAKESPSHEQSRELALASASAAQAWAYKSLKAELLAPVPISAPEAIGVETARLPDPLPKQDVPVARPGGAGGGEGAAGSSAPAGSTERAWIVEGDRAEVFDLLRRLAELARKEGFELVNGELPADAPELLQRDRARRLQLDAAGVPAATPTPSPAAPQLPSGSVTPAPGEAADKSRDKAAGSTRIVLRFRTQS